MLEPRSARARHQARLATFIELFPSEVKVIHPRALLDRVQGLMTAESGQGMVEYALILVLIAVVVIVILIVLGIILSGEA